jgi:hypothetical protein
MTAAILGLSSAFGLSASAGLNTTLPLLLVGVLARIGWLHLASPYDTLASNVALAGLAVLGVVEFVGDKVPAVDSVIHALQWPLAAAAGAILFASQAGIITWMPPQLALLVGLLTAGAVHGARAAGRPVVTGLTLGSGNVVASTLEDAYAVALAATSLLAPVAGVALLLVLLVAVVAAVTWGARRAVAARQRLRTLPLGR